METQIDLLVLLTVPYVIAKRGKFMKIQKCVGKSFSHIKQSVHKEQMDSSSFVSLTVLLTTGWATQMGIQGQDGGRGTGTRQGQTVKVNRREEATKMCALQITSTWEQQKARQRKAACHLT